MDHFNYLEKMLVLKSLLFHLKERKKERPTEKQPEATGTAFNHLHHEQKSSLSPGSEKFW